MNKSFYIIGLNHKNAPIELREKLAFDESSAKLFLKFLKTQPDIDEAVLLSTCNRTELYVLAHDSNVLSNGRLSGYLTRQADCHELNDETYFYKYSNHKAVEHLFRVASGIDSMILGEDQILHQVRRAYALACEAETAGKFCHKVFHLSFRVGKKSRSETDINLGAASVGSVSVELANKIFSSFENKSILLIGAGEIANVTLLNLKKMGAKHIYITNRTYSKAEKLALEFDGHAIPFDALPSAIQRSDAVISSTASRETLINQHMLKNIMAERKNRPLFLIDIAVPRDIDKSVKDLYNVYLYDIDDLELLVDKNLNARKSQIPKVENIIENELIDFKAWTKTLQVVPTIKDLHQHFEEIRKREVEKNKKHFSIEDQQQLDAFSRALLKKVLHNPIIRLNACKDSTELCGRCTVRQVFGLDKDD